MAEKINNIAKNTSYLTFALVIQKIISFTYFTLLARNLGAENLGKYYFAISFVTIFGVFIDLGLINVLTREIAKKKDDAEKLLGSIITIKLPLAILALISVILAINILNYPSLIKNLVYLASICMIADSFTNTFFAVARGFHNLLFESISSVLFQLIVMALGLTAVYMGMNLVWIMGAMVLASVFNFSYSLIVIWKKIKIKIKLNLDKPLIKAIINLSIPFGLFALFQRFYMYFDSVLLSILAG
ncbi:oligosaccharide flippase family protein, partial [bacterium]|nr:oligosaccharide flippase family protein [bacterium]